MNFAILLAAGKGERAGAPQKAFAEINGKPVLFYALKTFYEHPQIHQFALVIREDDRAQIESWLESWRMDVELIVGGETRQKSAENAMKTLPVKGEDLLIFHNAVNPFVTQDEISAVIDAAEETGAACVAQPMTHTLKKVKSDRILSTLDRSKVYGAETPQAIQANLYQRALDKQLEGTDEMMLAESLGVYPKFMPASENNFKITTKRDLEFARFLMEGGLVRTGIGMDSHRFDREHKGLTLGGIQLKESPKMIANSDGDVMIHALCNAILQALGEGSLGTVADEMCAAGIIDSRDYLKTILKKMTSQNLTLRQVGFQIEGALPKIDPIADELRKSLANLLDLDVAHIGITASTGEDLTPFGRGEGLQCFATVTLSQC